MDLTINQQALLAGLQAAAPLAPRHPSLPILGHGLLTASLEAGLWLTATDLDLSLHLHLEANIVSGGSLAVPLHRLREIVQELPAGEVTVAAKNNRLTIAAGRARFALACLPPEDFPAFPAMPLEGAIPLRGMDLRRQGEAVLYAAAGDPARPMLSGVFCEVGARDTRMTATDGHRLARHSRSVEDGREVRPEAIWAQIVPAKGLAAMARMAQPNDLLEMALGTRHVHLRTAPWEMAATVLEGPYPNVEAVLPTGPSREVVLPREEWMAAIRRVATMAPDTTKRIVCAFSPGRCRLAAVAADRGNAEEEMEVPWTGDDFSIAFNADYLLEALRSLASPSVHCAFGGPERPAVFRPAGQEPAEDLLALIMPLRILGGNEP